MPNGHMSKPRNCGRVLHQIVILRSTPFVQMKSALIGTTIELLADIPGMPYCDRHGTPCFIMPWVLPTRWHGNLLVGLSHATCDVAVLSPPSPIRFAVYLSCS